MAPSVLLLLALATTPAPAHNFSTTCGAELLSSAGAGSVKAALRSDARPESAAVAAVAGAASVHAALRADSGIASATAKVAGTASVRAVSGTEARTGMARSLADIAGTASVAAVPRAPALAGAASAATREAALGLRAGTRGIVTASGTVSGAAAGTASITQVAPASGTVSGAAAVAPAAGTASTAQVAPASGSVGDAAAVAPAAGTASIAQVAPAAGTVGDASAAGTASTAPSGTLSGTQAADSTQATGTATATDTSGGNSPQPARSDVSDLGRAAARAGAAALNAAALALSSKAAAPSLADADASYSRGLEALKAKDSRTAITELSACVEAAPSRADCRWELGWAYQVEGRWADALAQWTEVQKLQPDHPDLEAALAQARGQAALQAKLSQAPQASTRPPPPPGAKVRMRFVGDVMLGTTVPEGYLPPEGAASVIAGVRPLLEDADLTFVNLEGPLCDGGKTTKCRSKGNCYAFRSPTSYGQVLKDAGVDLASTANNHSGDFGEECRRETEATLDALGIPWSGPPGSIATIERNGLRIGMVAFHTSPSCNHLNNLTTATALVRAAAAEHDLVVVSFHGGAEGSKALHVPQGREMFFGEDRGDLRTFSRAVVDAGAHLVIGHGPHVVRGLEFYKGRLIAYSLGNFATYGRFTLKGPQGLGMVLEVELDGQGRFQSGRILPTKQVDKGIAVPDASGAVIPLVRGLTADDFPDSGARISEDGTVKPSSRGPATVTGSSR